MSAPPTLTSPLLAALPGVRHAFFTRQGGVSEGVYDSLNVGVGSGDAPDRVAENRARTAGAKVNVDARSVQVFRRVTD